MLVNNVDLSRRRNGALVNPRDPGTERDFDLRVAGFDRSVELGEAFAIERPLLLVADFKIFQRKRFGMTVLRTHRTPPGCDRADGVFDGVERILNQSGQLLIRQKGAATE